MAAAAALLAASFFLSRVLGFVREAVLAYRLGVGADTDAYYAAFQIPDMLNHFLGIGALSIALIPLYTRIRTERGEEAANRVFATVLGTLGFVALLATSLLWWFAEPLVVLQFPDFTAEQAGADGSAHAHRPPRADLLRLRRNPAGGADGEGPLRRPGGGAADLQRRNHRRRALPGAADRRRGLRLGSAGSAPPSDPSATRCSTSAGGCRFACASRPSTPSSSAICCWRRR